MTTSESVDLQAVSRVARNIDLRDIRVVQVLASLSPTSEGSLEPKITFDCKGSMVEPDQLNVICDYTLTVSGAGANVRVMYLLVYEVSGSTPTEQDVEQFAKVNAVYHSWPFLRQFLYDLTSKMGLPALTLPVFQVLSRTHEGETEKLPAPKKAKARKALSE